MPLTSTLASSSYVQLRIIEETAFGTTPVVGNPNNLRMTGESLAFSQSKSESAEIRSDRQVADLITTNASAAGGVNFEMSYKEYDALLQAALMGTWSFYGASAAGVGQGVGAAIPVTGGITTTGFTATAPTSGANILTGLAKGQWFKLNTTGGTGINNGKIVRVSETTGPTTTVMVVDTATPLVADAGVTAVTLSSSRLSNGVVERSFTLERNLTDVTQFFQYRGMEVSKMSLKVTSGGITTGSFDFMGKDGARSTVTAMPGSPIASLAYDVQNGVTGVGNILESGSALAGTFIKSIDLSLDNSLRARDALGTLGAVSIGAGTLKVTGTMEVYLNDGALYDKMVNNTTTSIEFTIKDNAGNGYVVQLPAIKYGDAKVQAGGKDQDMMLSLPFTAIIDQSANGIGKMIIIDRVGV